MMTSWRRSLLPAFLALLLPALSHAQVSIDVSVNVPPPELPVYDQPPIPDDGYIWTPGYWAWGDDIQDYYWVPGTWVAPPEPEYLWTPGYWGVAGGAYLWHIGYWGPHVGFYGGVNYGHGYGGNGYEGGYWQGGHMYYNRSVNNISNVHVTNVYNKTVINNVTINRVSYNGGNGIHAQPTPEQAAAARDRHIAVTPTQRQHEQAARANPALRVSENHGHPSIAATSRPGAFTGAGVVGARQGGNAPPQSPQSQTLHNVPQRQAPDVTRRAEGHGASPGEQRQPQPPAQRQPEQRPVEQRQPQPFEQRQPEQRQVPQRQPQPTEQRPPEQRPVEQRQAPERRAPEQAQPPRPSSPPPQHQSAPRPAEHAPEHQEDHEHH